jgi:hypothetical protein
MAEIPDFPILTEHYVTAARFFNLCRSKGIQGSNTDFLICVAAALFVFSAASARTGIVALDGHKLFLPVHFSHVSHYAGRFTARKDHFRHDPEKRVHVVENAPVGRTQIAQPPFPVRCSQEPVLRAIPVTGKQHVAREAVGGQRRFFETVEATLLV